MIAARIHDDSGRICIMLVLEPGNIEKLKQGEPIHKFLGEFVPELNTKIELLFAYTPDAAWVAEQAKKEPRRLAEFIEASLSRPEVVIRDKTAEDMKRAF